MLPLVRTVRHTKVRIAHLAKAKHSRAKIAAVTKEAAPRRVKTTVATATTVHHIFNAPLRLQAALAVPVKHVRKGNVKHARGGGSVVAMIEAMAPQYGVPTWFALRIAKVESNYNPNARGRAGELGVFQMKCATARGIGYRGNCEGLLNARTGVQYGLKHLSIALKSSRGNLKLAASKHNGGLGCKRLVPRYVAMVF
ncbi:MAG TPA: transglycosylase SLT domain-containing protein [Aestuariivirga sp.]|nr:transglycosylase SLT domain-containing protein [Aestuariivirga sp.]